MRPSLGETLEKGSLGDRSGAESENVEHGFPDAQLRTLQRRLKVWRRAAARKLVFTPDIAGADAAVAMMN